MKKLALSLAVVFTLAIGVSTAATVLETETVKTIQVDNKEKKDAKAADKKSGDCADKKESKACCSSEKKAECGDKK